jgi:group I intron endonuclease
MFCIRFLERKLDYLLKIKMRILKSHPLLKMVNSYAIDSPQPSNVVYLWIIGSLIGSCFTWKKFIVICWAERDVTELFVTELFNYFSDDYVILNSLLFSYLILILLAFFYLLYIFAIWLFINICGVMSATSSNNSKGYISPVVSHNQHRILIIFSSGSLLFKPIHMRPSNKLFNSISLCHTYSTTSGSNSFIVPVLKYDNADISKRQAVKDNRGKSGIYRWINKVNGNSYVGSSVNLGKRFSNYYSFNYITDPKRNMLIHKALIKHGYSNFTLEVLEYCDTSNLISREQYYINLLQPLYNILQVAGSSLGFTHSKETLAKFKARSLTPEHKARWNEHLESHNASKEQRERSRERMLELNKLKGISVEVFDTKTNETLVYPSIRQAAEAIGCVHRTILLANKVFEEKGIYRLIKKRYTVNIKKS